MRSFVRSLLPAIGLLFFLSAPGVAQQPQTLPLGEWVTGTLADDAGTSGPTYLLPADVSGRVLVRLESDEFDTVLNWTVTRDGRVVDQDRNDDAPGEDGTNSLLRLEVPEQGEGLLRVSAYAGGGGEYRIQVNREEEQPAQSVAYGFDLEGYFDSSEAGPRYEFQGAAGDQVWVTLESMEFDPVLAIALNGAPVAGNDDGFVGANSLVQFILPESGTYEIRVQSFQNRGSGPFRLRLGQGADRPEPDPRYSYGGQDTYGQMEEPAPVPSTYLVGAGVVVPAESAPDGLAFTEEELGLMTTEGGMLLNRALGISIPMPDGSVGILAGQERERALNDIAEGLAGDDLDGALITNFGLWGPVNEGQERGVFIVAARSEVEVGVEEVANLGLKILNAIDRVPVRWMDIRWEDSRSVYFFVGVDDVGGETSITLRCTTGAPRDRGGLAVCAVAIWSGPWAESEEYLAGLEVR